MLPKTPKTPKEILEELNEKFIYEMELGEQHLTGDGHAMRSWFRSALTSLLLEAKGRIKDDNEIGTEESGTAHMVRAVLILEIIDALVKEVEQS